MDYSEIFKLKAMLEAEGIPFGWRDLHPLGVNGYGIIIGDHISAIQADRSYGGPEGRIEIKGAMTYEEMEQSDFLGWLSAEEVFERFKYCYKYDTQVYQSAVVIDEMREISPIEQLLDPDNSDNVVLYNEDGRPIEFEQIAMIPLRSDPNVFYALLAPVDSIEGVDEGEGLIFAVSYEEGTVSLVTDQSVIDTVFEIYQGLLADSE